MEGQQRALKQFERKSWFNRSKVTEDKKFMGKHILSAKEATEPTLILWKNLGVTRGQRMFYLSINILITLVIWVASTYAIASFELVDDDLQAQ